MWWTLSGVVPFDLGWESISRVLWCVGGTVFCFSVKNKTHSLLTQLVETSQIWNLYSEFPLKARVIKWVPALELWEDSVVSICGLAVLSHGRRFAIKGDTQESHCSVSRMETEAGTFCGQKTEARCSRPYLSLPSENGLQARHRCYTLEGGGCVDTHVYLVYIWTWRHRWIWYLSHLAIPNCSAISDVKREGKD